MNWVAVIAYLIDLCATFVTQIAYILMKKGMIKVENTGLNGTKKKIGFFTCEWLTGFAFLTIGSIVHVAALPFCDLVVLSTNSSIGIVFNNILSVMYLGEKVVWVYDITAVSLIILGSLIIVFLSNYESTTYTPEEIHTLLFSTSSLVFASVTIVFSILTIVQFKWH